MAQKFGSVSEKDISGSIVAEFATQFQEYVQSDCIIVGGGPSGLMAGRNLARAGKRVLIIERNNYLGGGFWIGGFLMNTVTIRRPGERILDELGIPYKALTENLWGPLVPMHVQSLLLRPVMVALSFSI